MKKESLFENLNAEQLKAVTTKNGPLLILAGAGSGKTRVITYRIAHLIHDGVAPENILAVTFTNKAAGEMKERVADLLDKPVKSLWIGTFHSVCVRILRAEIGRLGYERTFSIYDTSDQVDLIKSIAKELGYDEKMIKPRAVASRISGAKNELVSPTEYAASFANTYFEEKVAEVYEIYQKRLKQANALDFDDLIGKTIQIFRDHPEVLAKYQSIFRYILVDEYQDTNHAQYLLINLLVSPEKNICVVGDPDQSIYNFRGADIRNILNFEKDYPETKIFKLEENYRSTQNILLAAQKLIENNQQRKSKGLWTNNTEGDAISIIEVGSESEEGNFISDEIKFLRRRNIDIKLNDIVIFYRTHAQSRALEESMIRSSIPYRIVGGVTFYERREVKDILAYLRIIHNGADFVSLARVINTPPRGIGKVAFEKVKQLRHLDQLDEAFLDQLDTRSKKSISNFHDFYRKIRVLATESKVTDLITSIVTLTGYKEYILDGTKEGEARWENVRELMSVAQRFDSLEVGESLSTFLQDVALFTNMDEQDFGQDSVSMMTLHSAKGLEFDYVFIVGMEESIFPSTQALNEDREVEEERRLCYVGITRARKKLYLLHANARMIYGGFFNNQPSRFLNELPEDTTERIRRL